MGGILQLENAGAPTANFTTKGAKVKREGDA
jgi:hypothetical protein